ncbi:hypothetical protein V1264_010734 [Littorina saxatilis]|uniref:DUF3752 domain-containing protein n=1 Tax=Littorina saxatilis TaxID=31220 RepID=A0AAN9AQE6_9CAEN
MADTEHFGPALPPATQSEGVTVSIGPALPPGFVKQEAVSSPGPMDEGNTQTSDSGQGGEGGADGEVVGPMVSEMSHGDEVVQAAEEFERRSRKMKDHLTVKAEAEPGPSKREEWMTELPPEMGKTIGVTARTFSNKGGGTTDDKDRSDWTDTPADKIKKEKEGGKSKKRKRDEGEKNVVKQRDDQLQQQIEEYNKKKRPESLVEMHQKSKKKKKASF